MSPEQARGALVDARSDLWSLGVVLYQMLAGSLPFAAKTQADVLAGILEREPASLATSAVPAELQRIVRKALAKDRDQRYQTAAEFGADLRRVLARVRPAGGLVSRPAIAGAAGALAVAVVAGFAAWQYARPPVTSELTYSLIAQQMRDGEPAGSPYVARATDDFQAGWRFRLRFQSPEAGFVYLLNEAPSTNGVGELSILFPLSGLNPDRAAFPPNQPVETDWSVFDQNPGVEKLRIIWARRPVSELDEAAREAATPEQQGRITAARANAIRGWLAGLRATTEVASGGATTIRGNRDLLGTEIDLRHR